MQISKKVVLITGASEGIGAALATICRARGAKLALLARSKERLAAIAQPGDLIIPADLTDPVQRAAAIARTLETFQTIDILINNAGVGVYQNSFETDPEAASRMFDVNLFAPVDLVQRVVPAMRAKRSGYIVNVSSIAGVTPLPWLTLYSASKAAINAWGDGLRTELKPHGIRVMTVCPGYVRTRFQSNILAGRPPDLGARTRQWAITPEKAASDIVSAIEKDKEFLITPTSGWALVLLQRMFPSLLRWQFEKIYRKDHAENRT